MAGCGRGCVIAHAGRARFCSPQVKLTVPLEGRPSYRITPAGTQLGGRRCAARPVDTQHRLWHVNQLRDPAILEDKGRVYLFYAVAGESGIASAELLDD
jgi:hypothetical protein